MKDSMECNHLDLGVLARSAREDLEAERWVAYPHYIAEFNRLLKEFEKSNIDTAAIDPIQPVPEENLSADGPGGGTVPEQAKLREIVFKSERLRART